MPHKLSGFGVMPLVYMLGLYLCIPIHAAPSLTLHHIHGLSYSADGKQLYIPMHHGLAIYNGSQWSKAPGPEHDYMGFAVTVSSFIAVVIRPLGQR